MKGLKWFYRIKKTNERYKTIPIIIMILYHYKKYVVSDCLPAFLFVCVQLKLKYTK